MRFAILAGAVLGLSAPVSATVIEGFVAPTNGNVTLRFNQLFPANGQFTTFQLEWTGGTLTDAGFGGGGDLRQLWWEQPFGAPQPILWGNEYTMPIGCYVSPGESCTDNFVRLEGRTDRASGMVWIPKSFYDCDTVKILDRVCSSFYNVGAVLEANIASDTGVQYKLTFNTSAVPEPGVWAAMIAGFGLVGGAIRRRRASLSYV